MGNPQMQIHKSKWSLISVLYILTRYYPLLIWPIIFYASVFDHGVATCRTLMRPIHILKFPFVSDFSISLIGAVTLTHGLMMCIRF